MERVNSGKETLEKRWKALPVGKRRKLVLYMFAAYLTLTVAVVLQVICGIGPGHEKIPMRHIENPIVKMQQSRENNPSKTVTNGK